jgi:hypothetical protein
VPLDATVRVWADVFGENRAGTPGISRVLRERPESSLLVSDFVVTAAQGLDETNAVTEGIGHVGDAAPFMRLDLALCRGASFNLPDWQQPQVQIPQNHWYPMSSIAAHLVCIY